MYLMCAGLAVFDVFRISLLALLEVVLILTIFSERKLIYKELFKYSSYIAQSRCKSRFENVSKKTEFAHVTVSKFTMPWGTIQLCDNKGTETSSKFLP